MTIVALVTEKMCMESKIIKISSRKQITIPQAYYEKLGLGKNVECILKDNEIVLRPLDKGNDDYSDLILEDLLKQGYRDDKELLEKFREAKGKIRLAAQSMIEHTVNTAKNDPRDRKEVHEEIFSDIE